MIQFSNTIANLLQQPSIEAIHLVKISTYLSCNYFRNLTLSNGDTYLADGNLLGVDAPQAISVVSKETYNIAFADPEMIYGGFAEEGLLGRVIEVRLCFIDPSTNLPLLDLADTILMYKGHISGTSYKVSTAVLGSSVFHVEASGPMSDLDKTKNFYTSKFFIQSLNPNDNCFDQVYEGSGAVNMRWGK